MPQLLRAQRRPAPVFIESKFARTTTHPAQRKQPSVFSGLAGCLFGPFLMAPCDSERLHVCQKWQTTWPHFAFVPCHPNRSTEQPSSRSPLCCLQLRHTYIVLTTSLMRTHRPEQNVHVRYAMESSSGTMRFKERNPFPCRFSRTQTCVHVWMFIRIVCAYNRFFDHFASTQPTT